MHNWVPRGSYKKMKLCREFDLEVPSPWMENQRSRSIGNTSRHLRALIGSENLEQITSKFSQKFQRRRNFGFCRSEYSRRFPFSSNLAIGNSWISMIENAKMHFHRIFPSFCLMDEHDIEHQSSNHQKRPGGSLDSPTITIINSLILDLVQK